LRKWSLIALLGLGVIIAYVDRTNLAIALASPDFKQFFGLTDAGRGVLNSVFFWSYTIMQIPAGLAVDRFGVKRLMTVSFVAWCLVAAATAMAGAFWQLIALRLMLGVAESALFPAGLAWLAKHVDERQRGLAAGIFVSGSKWGPAIASPLATWLILGYGWRTMFFLLGLGGLVWVIPWIVLAGADPPRKQETGRSPNAAVPFSALFRTRAMWATVIGTFCYNYFLFFSLTWMPAYLVESRNLTLTSMSIYTMFSFAGTGTVAILAGAAADWMIRRGANALNVALVHYRRPAGGFNRSVRGHVGVHRCRCLLRHLFHDWPGLGYRQLLGDHPDLTPGCRSRARGRYSEHGAKSGRHRRADHHRMAEGGHRRLYGSDANHLGVSDHRSGDLSISGA